MAKYNREFLVPYLENICALHFAEIKLDNYLDAKQNNINKLIKGTTVYKPSLPEKESLLNTKAVATCIISLLICLMSFSSFVSSESSGVVSFGNTLSSSFSAFIGTVSMIVFIVAFINIFVSAVQRKAANTAEEERYYRESKEYERIKEQNDQKHKKGLALNRQLQGARDERQRVSTLLQKSYGANVIPGQYRNVYAAMYLYDYFRNSRADDLDLVLNTFVLEQIKERLDIIIASQSEMILNQRILMANQEKSIEQQRFHHNQLMDKLDQIHAQGEERNLYEQMIESHTAASAYFAAAEYIRNI